VKAGKAISVLPWSYDLFGIAVTPDEVPYVVAFASDEPMDLTRFGKGKTWQYRVRLDGLRDPDATIESVARSVARDTAQRFAADFGYVAPRVSVGTQLALAKCASLSAISLGSDAHDYWFYRDLWMSFGPRDGYWFASISPWIGWGWNGLAPMLFPSMAAFPMPGGCSTTLRLPTYAYVAPDYPPAPVRRDTTVRDSTMKGDSTRAAVAGRTIAVEVPRGGEATGTGMEALVPGAARRFSPSDIARIRTGYYAESDGNAAHAEAIAGRHGAAPVDRRSGSTWTAEPMDARPTSRAGAPRYTEPEEASGRRYLPAGRGPARSDPERAYGSSESRGAAASGSGSSSSAGSSGSSGSSGGWQRPTSVGGADVTRAAAPSTASGARPTAAAPGGGSATGGTTAPKGQQQQQQQQ
jgi:uncharacterized membrane protein YgcG